MRIHMLGIGGTGMGSLAGLFVEAGHEVTGTDEAIYPPMSDQLDELGIKPFLGYKAENIAAARPELVIVGNVIRRENVEAQEVMRLGIKYRSMPAALGEMFLAGRTPIVIAGTHGKTTCATLAAWLLHAAGESPGFMIGGIGLNLMRSYEMGSGRLFVVEGDEYDTAFFDKGPKFLHYRPHAALITSIEFDHADIYRNVEQIENSFEQLAGIVPPDGLIAVNASDERAMRVCSKAAGRIVTYGGSGSASYKPRDVVVTNDGMTFFLSNIDVRFFLPMWGEHNLANAAGVLALLIESGVDTKLLAEGLGSFKGVRRRQEVLAVVRGVSVIDDFAHHPTAVEKTIESMRQRFPNGRIWAIFEPRSNTSRRNIFQKEFISALANADRVIVASPFKEELLSKEERFDSQTVADEIMKSGTEAHHIASTDDIAEFVLRNTAPGDVLLIMSNGGFGGLHRKIIDGLKKLRGDAQAG